MAKINYSAYKRLARLDKPAGGWLLLLPCWMGLALAGSFNWYLYLLFAIGAFTMRAAGCVVNDIIDREFDARVERTRTRPIASGEISVEQALAFLGLLLAIGLIVLLQLPMLSVYIGLSAVPLFVIYPFMKRVTYWPQLFLGITFNIGILVAYASGSSGLHMSAAILYIGAIFWTLGYDTIYAHQDKLDDEKIGVKSTALRLGTRTKTFVIVSYLIFLATIMVAMALKSIINPISIAGAVLAGLHFAWQVRKLDINSERICALIFKSNTYAGLLVVLTLLGGNALNLY